jgi:cellulose biosynthesis protein BcsQ
MTLKKVLLAVGFRQLEEYIERQLRKEFQFVEPTVYREGIIRSVGQKNPDIIVIRETLQGTENILSIIYELRQRYSKKRIIFIAGKREVGDALLASLVSMNVYDILYGDKVKAQDIIGLVRNPNEYKDVQHLQPKPVFDDRTNQVLFQAPDIVEKEVIKEIVKEVYVDNGKPEKPQVPIKKPNEVPEKTPSVPDLKKEEVEKKEEPKEEVKEEKVEVKKEEPPKPSKKEKVKEEPNDEENSKGKKGLFDIFSPSAQPVTVSGKQKILTFMGSKRGVGNTSIAFNTAVSLAQRNHKVLFMELEDRTPSVAYWYELGGENLEHGIDKALNGLSRKQYKHVEDSIIKTVDLQKTESTFKKNYKKFPETLDFMFFSNRYLTRQVVDNIHIEEAVTRELYLHLLFQLEYDFIILDVSANIWNETTLNALMYSHKVYITTTQDVSTIGNALYVLNELSKVGIHIDKKKNYIVNRFEKADLNIKEIEDWVQTKGVLTVPDANKDFINANYEGLPVLLSSKNSQIKQAIQRIEKTI